MIDPLKELGGEKNPLLPYLPCLFVLFLWVLLCVCLSFSALTSLPSHIAGVICFSFVASLRAAGALPVPSSASPFPCLCSHPQTHHQGFSTAFLK